MKIRIIKTLLTLILVMTSVSSCSSSQYVDEGPNEEIYQTAMKLQKLIKKKQSEGVDVSKALSLDLQSRESMRQGQPEECLRHLKEAVSILQEKGYQPQKLSRNVVSTPGRKDSPFGIHEVRFYSEDEVNAIKDLGIQFTRNAPYGSIVWEEIEKTRGQYNWNYSDGNITAAYDLGIKSFITIYPNRTKGPSKVPDNLDWFLEFLEKASERYDGDGHSDAPGSPKIDVIQIGNEVDGPFWDDTPENYALLLKKSYLAIKSVSPHMKVAIAGVATPTGFYYSYIPILDELNRLKQNPNDQYFDIFDIHWSAQFPGDHDHAVITLPLGQYELKKYVSDVKNAVKQLNYENVEYYITEMSDYSDSPQGYDYHSETYHAGSVIKRYVYSLAAGVDKIYWSGIFEEHQFGGRKNGYFDHVGLINNPRNDRKSHKKLAYYTYKKMVEILEGSDWNTIETINESDGIFFYRLMKNGKPVWVGWNDNEKSQTTQLTLDGIKKNTDVVVTKAVPNCSSLENEDLCSNPFGKVPVVVLKDSPEKVIQFKLDAVPVFVH